MKVLYDKSVMHSPLAVLRKAGYSPFMDPQSGEHSFVLRLTSEFYPRFHLYVDEKGGEVTFNLHLDQKKPSYGANHMHGGEYEGSTVSREVQRIASWANAVTREEHAHLDKDVTEEHDTHAPKKPTKWSRIFWRTR